MLAILRLLAAFIANLFKSRRRLEAEILSSPSSTQYRFEATTGTSAAAGQRSRAAGVDDPAVAEPARYSPDREPGDDPAVASGGLPEFLAPEIAKSGRGGPRIDRELPRSHPTNEPGKPVVARSRIHGELLKLGFELAEFDGGEWDGPARLRP